MPVADEGGGSRGVYSIGAVARMLDIPVATIRNWEERYGGDRPGAEPGRTPSVLTRPGGAAALHRGGGLAGPLGGRCASTARRTQRGRSPERTDGAGARTRLLVLLAERDPVAADLAQFFLRTEGYDVHLALAVDEAEEQWVDSRPQLAIVELMISGGRGVELCRRLKQHEAGAVLAISVLEARDEALAAGADAFLQKPLDPLELVSTVKDLLGSSALVARRGQESRLVDERGTSGDEGLDQILGGGLPMNGINLIMGRPGSGKTILCQQFMFASATEERPAVYLSTVSEPFEKILRYAQTLSFFDRSAIGRSIFYEDLGPAVAGDGGLTAVTERIARADQGAPAGDHRDRQLQGVGRVRARTHASSGASCTTSPRCSRPSLPPASGSANTARTRRARRRNSPWPTESSRCEREQSNQRTLRLIEVTKLRGSDFRSGRHTYRLSRDGITVFPRLADPVRQDDYRLSEGRISTGIAPLDRCSPRATRPGSSTLVAGPSGSGKTLMGLHFIFSGAANGEPGVIATLQENPIQLEKVARGFGWSLDDERVAVMYRSPNDVYVDEWVYELLDLVETTGAKRVMIDSLSDLQYATPDPVRFREFVYSLTQRLSRAGISPIMTSEIPDLFHVGRLAEYGISHLSDNVVLLQYLRAESSLLRTVTILKSRASAHDPEIREFEITPDGIVLGDPIAIDHA